MDITQEEKERRKMLYRKDELSKQENALLKEYTTILRKMVSISSVLGQLETDQLDKDTDLDQLLISDDIIKRASDLQWYNEKIIEVYNSSSIDDIQLSEELEVSWKMFKDVPLTYHEHVTPTNND